MDQRSSSASQMAFSRNTMVIASIVLVALGIIILLVVIFGNNSNCDNLSSSESFDKPSGSSEDHSEIEITQDEANNIAKTQDLADVEGVNTRNIGTDTSDLSTVEDINRARRREIKSDRGVDTIVSASDVPSDTNKTEDTTGETVESDSNLETVGSPQNDRKKRKRNTTETSGTEWTEQSSLSSDFSSPTDKSSV